MNNKDDVPHKKNKTEDGQEYLSDEEYYNLLIKDYDKDFQSRKINKEREYIPQYDGNRKYG